MTPRVGAGRDPALCRILAVLGLALVVLASVAAPAHASVHLQGQLPGGALYAIDRPDAFNGTVLLWSHGYAPRLATTALDTAPPKTRDLLLAQGYGLVASSYAAPGWALGVAPTDQLAALRVFAEHFGTPRRIIAWGGSMGGLVTVALAERYPTAIDGALPFCGSVGGSVGMMNMALDGGFAFATLAAPDAGIRLVGIDDDRANGARAAAAVQAAQATSQGRARIALAAALGGIPAWSDPAAPEPAPADAAGQEQQAAKTFVFGVMLPRGSQEGLAGGVFSWNTGIDYRAQLARSDRRGEVQQLYAAAGLSLDQDLATLARTRRIVANPAAVSYMKANYTPDGHLSVPLLSVHTIGDGLTSPSMERGYAELVEQAARSRLLGEAFVRRAGHCSFSAAEYLAALHALEHRLQSGVWSISPDVLNAGGEDTRFTAYRPTPFLRPCAGNRRCAGEPIAQPVGKP